MQGHRQVPATKHYVAVIRPHYAYSGLKQPQIWRDLCKRLTGVYSRPCSFGRFGGHGLSCGCFATDPTTYMACKVDSCDRSTAVVEVVREHVAAVLHNAKMADVVRVRPKMQDDPTVWAVFEAAKTGSGDLAEAELADYYGMKDAKDDKDARSCTKVRSS